MIRRNHNFSVKKEEKRKYGYAFKRRTRGCILICSSSGSENNHKDGFFFFFSILQCETSLWIGFSDVTDPVKGISLSFSPSKREKGGEGIKEDEVKTEEK